MVDVATIIILFQLQFTNDRQKKKVHKDHIQGAESTKKYSFPGNIIICSVKPLLKNRNSNKFTSVGLKIMAGQQTMSRLIGELTRQHFILLVMLTGHIWSYWTWNKLKFPRYSVVSVVISKGVDVYWWTLIWNPKWNATRTVVYNARMETDTGVHALLVSKFKMFSFLLLKQRLFSGLLLGCGKKSQVLRDFQSQIHEKISREFRGNFGG